MPQESGTQLFKTEKFAFQYIALCSAYDYPFVHSDLPARVETLQPFVMSKKIVRVSINIPDALNLLSNRNFYRHVICKISCICL